MGVFDFLRSEAHVIKDKIIFTQKQRIVKLEEELTSLNGKIDDKHDEISKIRETHEASKDRLVEQIVDLSDKFAANHSKVIDLADENARLKVLLERKSLSQERKTATTERVPKKADERLLPKPSKLKENQKKKR